MLSARMKKRAASDFHSYFSPPADATKTRDAKQTTIPSPIKDAPTKAKSTNESGVVVESDYLSGRLRNSLYSMRGLKTGRARIVTAVFTFAMFYASVCSTMCAAGICPNELQHSTSGDNCDQMPAGHPDCPQKHAPMNHDCAMHHHPTANIVKADLPQFQLTNAGHINVNDLLVNSIHRTAFGLTAFSLADLAPPSALRSPLYQQTSILRI